MDNEIIYGFYNNIIGIPRNGTNPKEHNKLLF